MEAFYYNILIVVANLLSILLYTWKLLKQGNIYKILIAIILCLEITYTTQLSVHRYVLARKDHLLLQQHLF